VVKVSSGRQLHNAAVQLLCCLLWPPAAAQHSLVGEQMLNALLQTARLVRLSATRSLRHQQASGPYMGCDVQLRSRGRL
jgi:hypothetical protein